MGTTVRLAGISVEEAVAYNDRIEKRLLSEVPDEIANIWTRLGTAGVATDPMGIEQLTGQTFVEVRVDSQAIARYGVPTRNVLNVVEAAGSRR